MSRANDLALYHFDACPFCVRVRRAADRLGIELELRDIFESRMHLEELTAATGRRTVPVLRIHNPEGEDHWLPESMDIIDYLQQRFGQRTGT